VRPPTPEEGLEILPGGLESRALFPTSRAQPAKQAPDEELHSRFASVLSRSMFGGEGRVAPGRSPFAPVAGSAAETLKDVFAAPSPDDVVLKAREGTSLAR
jgi:hypothetical protein